jgi:hypothetical protein
MGKAIYGAAREHIDLARGNQISERQDFVYVERKRWIVLGDPNRPHAPPPHTPRPDRMVEGSSFIFIKPRPTAKPIPVCRELHRAGCGHPTTGSRLLFLED